ncbi:MAG: hypothetical protein AAGU21_07395 [Solidesulfovibrio sp.]|uniref:hypothetical protein n=1 Tax=Solidesulfovibrio sp. TaxID=2910990 RepID=UPI002B207195|nr:hypothetical protein [Solidesulfovibrio sp.]MEA4858321.1 hypothetical protein [Solidesulfovibrio sp.]
MGRDLAYWLAGYHFFKQQYVARNPSYIPLADKLFDLEEEFEQLGIKTGMKFRFLVQDTANHLSSKTMKKSYVELMISKDRYAKELGEKGVSLIIEAAKIFIQIDKIGGETWTNFGDDPSSLLDVLSKNEDIYWTIPNLCTSYKRREGSIRLPVNAANNIKFDEKGGQRKAVCTIDLNEPLDEQFNTLMKVLTLMAIPDFNDREKSLYDLDDKSYEIEYQQIVGKPDVSYDRAGDKSRAIGLWLWDKVNVLGCRHGSKIEAIKEFEQLSCFEKLGLGYDPDYYHFLRRTEACIAAAEVLTFDKKKPLHPKRKCTSGTRKRKLVPGTKTAK